MAILIDNWIIEILDDMLSIGRFYFVVFVGDLSRSEDGEKVLKAGQTCQEA